MDDIESDNAEIEKQSNEIEEKRSLVKIKMAIAQSLAKSISDMEMLLVSK